MANRTKNRTSSRTGATLYFAYGSNLSPTQMALRLPHSPTTSATPLAIARLDNFQWIICQAGYANVVKLPSSSSSSASPFSPSPDPGSSSPSSFLESSVYGILYNLHPADETALDRYEGHTPAHNPNPEPNFINNSSGSNSSSTDIDIDIDIERPFLQGSWIYNKHYLPVHIVKWLVDDYDDHVHVLSTTTTTTTTTANTALTGGEINGERVAEGGRVGGGGGVGVVRALVYVDEQRTQRGTINDEYIGRMNRAIAESTALGLPRDWVEAVIRKDVVAGVELTDRNYVGRIE